MAFDTEFTLNGYFRSESASRDPSTIELHLHWKHCRRVFRRTHHGILPPTEDEPLGPSRGSQFGFCFRLLSEFRHHIRISLAELPFQSPVCDFLYHQITSFVIDFAAERPTRVCPSLILVADINFVQKLYVDYTRRPLEFFQPRHLGFAAFVEETFILGGTTEGQVVDSNAFVDETFILGGTTDGWVGGEVESNSFFDETFILGIRAEVNEEDNGVIEMVKRIKRGKWVMEGEEEANCSVCLENYSEGEEVVTMECRHTYHEECILTWLKQKKTCPLCRRQI